MTTKKVTGHDLFSARCRVGFTMLETLVSLGVVAVIAVVVISSFFSRSGQIDLDNTARQIAALMREAQSRSIAGESGVNWGVHLENATRTRPFYALFRSNYDTSTISGLRVLPRTVSFSTSTLAAGSSTDVVFGKVSGLPLASAKIGVLLISDPRRSSTVNVASSGAVSY